MNPVFSGPAPGLAGDRGGDLAGAAPSEAQRSDLQAGQFAKRASFTRSVKESGPAIPGHGKGPPRVSAGSAGLTVLRQGWKPVRGEKPVPRWLDAKRDSPAPRSGETPWPTETWRHQHEPIHRRRRLQRTEPLHIDQPCSPLHQLRPCLRRTSRLRSTTTTRQAIAAADRSPNQASMKTP